MSDDYQEEARRILAGQAPLPNPCPQTSFVDWNTYTEVLATAAAVEQEIAEKDITAPIKCRVVLLQRHKDDHNTYIAIFEVPTERRVKLSPGDKAWVYLSPKPGDYLPDEPPRSRPKDCRSSRLPQDNPFPDRRKYARGQWDLRVLEPIPSSGRGIVTALIERRRRASGDGYLDPRPHPVSSIPTYIQGSTVSGRPRNSMILSKLLSESKIFATIIPLARHSIFCYVFEGLRELEERRPGMQQDVAQLLLGTDLDKVGRYDIYGSLDDISHANEDVLNLNDSQKQAIRLGRSAPAGFVLCHGGPGTGKTHFVEQAITPFLLDATKSHRLLLTSAGNRGADSMASGLSRHLQRLIGEDKVPADRYVVRLHSIMTERAIALCEAERERKAVLQAKLKEGKPNEQLGQRSHTSAEQPSAIVAHCQTFAACKYEGVEDERVQNLELSLGRRMLQIAGIKPGGPALTIGETKWSVFRDLYHRYRTDVVGWLSDDSHRFDAAIDDLMDYTISHATAVCATAAGAADICFTKNYQEAELIVVDEAARLPEYQWWPLLGLFPHAIGKIMVGDPDQLPPVAEFKGELRNPFEGQIETSLQERLQSVGMESAFFTVQYRAVPEIAAIYNDTCYESRLQNAESTSLTTRPLAQDIVSHNDWNYGMSASVIFYNAPNPTEERTFSGSKYCVQYAILVLKILEDLLRAGFCTSKPCSIAILTPYKGQERILRICKAKMEREYAAAADVILETADKVQGIEYDIVIVDPVAVTSPGFLDKNRLNVLFSRAKSGLYVVGHYSSWIKMFREDSRMLRDFGKALRKYRVFWPQYQELASPFFDPEILND